MNNSHFTSAIARTLAILLFSLFALAGNAAASPTAPEEGFDYREIATPQPTESGKKIEVIEFFWYECPHCNAMAPLIEPWAKRRQAVIVFKRVPVARNESAILQQQLYYALEALGKVEAMHTRIFDAIHTQKIPLKTAEQMADFLARYGIGKARFIKAFNSDTVRKKVRNAQQMTATFGVDSVPTIAVDGRHVTSASMMGGNREDTLAVVDHLIARSR